MSNQTAAESIGDLRIIGDCTPVEAAPPFPQAASCPAVSELISKLSNRISRVPRLYLLSLCEAVQIPPDDAVASISAFYSAAVPSLSHAPRRLRLLLFYNILVAPRGLLSSDVPSCRPVPMPPR